MRDWYVSGTVVHVYTYTVGDPTRTKKCQLHAGNANEQSVSPMTIIKTVNFIMSYPAFAS